MSKEQFRTVRRRSCPPAVCFALFAAAYTGADLVMNKAALGLGWTIFWPLNGITIALLLRTPRRAWLQLLLAVELGTLAGEILTGTPLLQGGLERVWSAVEVVLSALLLPAFVSMDDWLTRPNLVRRIGAALVLGPGVSGLLYAVHMHLQFHTSLWTSLASWAPPDALGNAIALPMALAFLSSGIREMWRTKKRQETVLLLAASTLVTLLIFSEGAYPLLFLLYPMLLYVDWKLSFAGASLVLFGSSIVGVFCTIHGLGPFGHWPATLLAPRGVALQMYLGFHGIALLPLSMVMMERKNIAGQLREANEQLQTLAQQDALTGIANRRAFDDVFLLLWDRSVTDAVPMSMLMIDIDHFKQYNDQHGHLVGDECLVRVAQLLRAAAGEGNRVARFGGEEFAVLLPGSGVQDCFQMAESLRRTLVSAAIPHPDSTWGMLTISIGCATVLPTAQGEPRQLLAEADAALYEAKKRGRNRLISPLLQETDWRHDSDEFALTAGLAALWTTP